MSEYLASQFGRLLQDHRKRAGLTQIQLAGLSTVSVRAIRDLELGSAKRPRRDTVRLLADALRLRAQRRISFEMAAGRDPATATFEAISGARSMPPPRPAGPIYGRDAEHRALVDLLVSGTHRLVTVTGLAGVGKTRLTQGVAYELHETGRMRVLWLPLAQLHPTDRPPVRLGTPATPLTSWILPLLNGTEGRLADLVELIGDMALLVVLDGVDATQAMRPSSFRNLLELLADCPNLRVVLTARPALELPGEHTFPVRPLSVGRSASGPGFNAAAELLSWHLRSVQPQLQLTDAHTEVLTQLCWWLDGIPGALIGAASWSMLMPLAELADLACRDPLTVGTTPARQYAPNDLQSTLSRLLTGLDQAEHSVLTAIATVESPMTLPEISWQAGLPLAQVAHLVHALLNSNLVRLMESEAENRFCVLNTVSSLLARAPLASSM